MKMLKEYKVISGSNEQEIEQKMTDASKERYEIEKYSSAAASFGVYHTVIMSRNVPNPLFPKSDKKEE
jgi:hypothetical protein